jgi:hypothetical protein
VPQTVSNLRSATRTHCPGGHRDPGRAWRSDPAQRALQFRLERREGYRGPAWHCHIADADSELTVGVFDDDEDVS